MKSSSRSSSNFSTADHIPADSEFDYLYDEALALNGGSDLSEDLVDDPFKRCILDYPFKNMKNVMVIVNFSLQFLIPSIVILYFYGKFLNLINSLIFILINLFFKLKAKSFIICIWI